MDPNAPSASAKPLAERMLDLIVETRHAEDLAPARIAATMHIPVEHDEDDAERYGFVRAVEGGWLCTLRSLPCSEGDRLQTRVSFAFEDPSGAYTDLSPVCALEFEDTARTLAAAGYAGGMTLGMRGAFDCFTFVRDGVQVDAYVRGRSPAEPARLCVTRLIVGTPEVAHA